MLSAEVLDATAYDTDADKPNGFTRGVHRLSVPSEIVIRTSPNQRLRRGKRPANPGFEFFFEFGNAPFIQDVLETGQLSIRAIAEVPVDRYDCSAKFKQFLTARADSADRVGKPRMRRLHPGTLSHPA